MMYRYDNNISTTTDSYAKPYRAATTADTRFLYKRRCSACTICCLEFAVDSDG